MIRKKNTKQKKVDKVADLTSQLARALADYDNLRKRAEKEREDYRKMASLVLITRLLPIVDMLEEAQKQLKDSGLAIIIKEFGDILNEEGVEKIKVDKGMRFDENLHEVAEAVDKGRGKDGEIVGEFLSGWKHKDGFVIRPTRVKVVRKGKK